MFIIFNVETGFDFGLGFIGVEVRGERGCSSTLYLLDVLNIELSVNTDELKLGRHQSSPEEIGGRGKYWAVTCLLFSFQSYNKILKYFVPFNYSSLAKSWCFLVVLA